MRSRRLAPLAAVAAAATAMLLTACSGASSGASSSGSASSAAASASPSTTATACASPGSASNAVKVSVRSGKSPSVSFPTPTSVTATQRTVVKQGTGETVKDGTSVRIDYALYEGKTGKKLDEAGYTSAKSPVTLTADTSQYLPGLVQSLVCSKVGDRLAAVMPASAAFGTAGSESLGVGGGDSLVLVADVLGITPTKATGTVKALPSGFPTVTLASNGQPTVTIPKATAPTKLEIADREVGSGETVKSGDTVTVQYQGVLWRTGAVFDQSWTKGGPTSFATTAVVKGFGKALVGQKVGSQVVAIIPPSEGYGSKGSSDGSIKGTDTMVFVIDVLATTHAAG